MKRLFCFIRKVFRVNRPSKRVNHEYKEQFTKCDCCKYLHKCISENRLLECITLADTRMHYIPMKGQPCPRGIKGKELFTRSDIYG